jgi:hypothetical protein
MKSLTPKQTKKTFRVTKISPLSSITVAKEVTSLFEDPSTYLRLPGETKTHFVVGKKLSGPRYDLDDQIIPYSIVGNPKIFKKKNLNANISSMYSQNKMLNRPDPNAANSNIITDKELDNIFIRCKDNIESNSTYSNEFLLSIPSIKEQTITKPLLLQQKTLEKYSINSKTSKDLSRKIKKKISKPNFRTSRNRSNDFNYMNMHTYTSPNRGLLMERYEQFRMKKETKEFTQKNADFATRYGKFHWMLGLRRPKHFNGIREAHINIGNTDRPVWCTIRESLPIINETIVNPYRSCNTDKEFIESDGMKTYMNSSPHILNFVDKTMNMANLEIKGKNLLQVEENNAKLLHGKKRLIHMKHFIDTVKDVNYVQNYN